MSSVSDMQWRVNEQRRINSELHSELNAIANGISNTHNKWDRLCNNISNSLNNGAQRVAASQNYMNAAYEMQGEIDKLYVLFKNIEQANKKIRECNNKKIYDFKNYSAVRKIVAAMLDNLEVSMVSDETITRVVEIKHLQLPDYWLTCALLSIMAWRKDDRELAKQALERACKLDKKETAVFFLVFNLRIGRDSAALKWFEYYQTCDLTGEDDRTFLLLFSIVNQAVNEDCSDEVISKVRAFIRRIIDDDIKRNGYSESDMIGRILYYLNRFVPHDTIGYTVLLKYCKERDFLASQMMLAKANIHILDFILKTIHVTDAERKDYLNSFIEEIVKKPNSVELEVEDEICYNELIIKNQGNVEAAQKQFEQIKVHRENDFDIITEMIDWIYRTGKDDNVHPMVRANMFAATKELNQKSVRAFVQSYRSRFKINYDIQINDYATNANLTDFAGEAGKLKNYFESKKAALLRTVKTWPSFLGFGAAALGIVGAVMMSPAMLVFTVGGAAFGAGYLLYGKSKRKSIIRDHDNEYQVSEGILNGIVNEFVAYRQEYAQYDSYAQKIAEEFDKI